MTCDDLATVNGQIKAVLRAKHQTPTAKLIAVFEAAGITDAKEIAECIGITERGVRKARNSSSEKGTTVPEPQFRCGTPVPEERNHSSENAEPQFRGKERVSPHTPLPKERTTPPRTTVAAQYEDARESDAAATRIGSKDLLRKLQAAAGDCLDPTSFENQHCAAANGWISAGADLETDILPVIAAKARTLPRHSVSSFSYFAKPVARAVEMRRSGLPAAPIHGYSRNDEKAALRRKNDAIFAKYTRRAEASA